MLRPRLARALTVLVALFGLAAFALAQHAPLPPARTPAPATAPDPDGLNPDERLLLTRVSEERALRGLSPLHLDALLVSVARGHSREMAEKNYFDHHSPTPGQETPLTRCVAAWRQAGQPLRNHTLVAENIYYCSLIDPTYNTAYCHQSLMNSPGHRANILDSRLSAIGLGTYRDAGGQFWATEIFQGTAAPDGRDGLAPRYPLVKLADVREVLAAREKTRPEP